MKDKLREKLLTTIKEMLDGTTLWSVWCNHYETKEKYEQNKDKDLEYFAEHFEPYIHSLYLESLPEEEDYRGNGSRYNQCLKDIRERWSK